MTSGRRELNPHGLGQTIKLDHILGVAIGNRDAEADILDAHGYEIGKSAQAMIKTILDAPQLVIGRRQAFNGNPDADPVAEFFG